MPFWTPYDALYDFYDYDPCWYWTGTDFFTVQAIDYFGYTKMIDLMYALDPYKICQKLTLTKGNNYTYSFDYGIHLNVDISTVTVYLNQVSIASFHKNSSTNR